MELRFNYGFIGISAAIALAFFFLIISFSAAMSILGIILLFILPAYLALNKFNLEQDEKIVFSFFIGAGIFPAIAYWIGRFISFRVAILIAFIALLVTAYFVNKYKK